MTTKHTPGPWTNQHQAEGIGSDREQSEAAVEALTAAIAAAKGE